MSTPTGEVTLPEPGVPLKPTAVFDQPPGCACWITDAPDVVEAENTGRKFVVPLPPIGPGGPLRASSALRSGGPLRPGSALRSAGPWRSRRTHRTSGSRRANGSLRTGGTSRTGRSDDRSPRPKLSARRYIDRGSGDLRSCDTGHVRLQDPRADDARAALRAEAQGLRLAGHA